MQNKKPVVIYTDGACSGNPGPGGWGAIITCSGVEKELSGKDPATTNNRMELMAAIMALNALTESCSVTLYTDSRYVMDGITKWMKNWKIKNWRTADNKPVKNIDLWQQLDAAAAVHKIDWQWVKGHSNHPMNDRADALARGF